MGDKKKMYNHEFDKKKIKVVAFDLDGTLTQHKSLLSTEKKSFLIKLKQKYKLLMAGAGTCERIFRQMDRFPIDIIGNYGLQYAEYDEKKHDIEIKKDITLQINKEEIFKKVSEFRKKFGYEKFSGESVEFHDSGCVTIPLLGTTALLEQKLLFDPDRKKRRAIYKDVCVLFSDFNVFVGGSSSFDMIKAPYNKYYALCEYCKEKGLSHEMLLFVGDDYGQGGNDEVVYRSDFPFLCIDDYTETDKKLQEYL